MCKWRPEMPRVTIHIPNDVHQKLEKMAQLNDASLSSTVVKMAEIGLLVSESKNKDSELEDISEVEKYCHKLTIQMNTLIKNIAAKTLDFTKADMDKITENSINKYNEIAGILPEEL